MNEMISTIKRFSPTQGEISVNKNLFIIRTIVNMIYHLFVCVYIFSKGR